MKQVTIQNNDSQTKAVIILSAIYLSAQMLSDIGSLKVVALGKWAIDAGTFIYPITFTLRDVIHKRLGKNIAIHIIFISALINIVMAGYFYIVSIMPPNYEWAVWEGSNVSMNEAFSKILSPAWYIVLASILAEVVSQIVDTEIYHLWVTRITKRFEWIRVLVSNAVSVPVDSFIFTFIAFGFGMKLQTATLINIFLVNVAIKSLVTVITLPTIYLVGDKEKLHNLGE